MLLLDDMPGRGVLPASLKASKRSRVRRPKGVYRTPQRPYPRTMARNTALTAARKRARLSQHRLAERIVQTGVALNLPNSCNKRRVQLWESGKIDRPQPHYVLALEELFGVPITALGFSAAEELGSDADEVMRVTGPWIPAADPAMSPGPLTGIWLSRYEYSSTSRGQRYSSRHFVVLVQHGTRIMIRSTPGSASRMKIDASLSGRILTGTWAEETDPSGYYQGAVYHGALQMTGSADGDAFDGAWVGFGKQPGEFNTDSWSLKLLARGASQEQINAYSRAPGEDD